MRLSTHPWLGLTAGALLLVSSGCATTARPQRLSAHELQGRVLHLETLAEQRDLELAQLREDLQAEREARWALERRFEQPLQPKATAVTGTLSIREMQRALQQAGFDPGAIDGKLGKRTRAAIRAFQQAHGLAVDGRIGPQTVAKLQPYIQDGTSSRRR